VFKVRFLHILLIFFEGVYIFVFLLFSVQSNYEPLNRNNDCIGQWSWYYRGCWHQTCPPLEISDSCCVRRHTKGSELLRLTAFHLSSRESASQHFKKAAMHETLFFLFTQLLQLVTASVKLIK